MTQKTFILPGYVLRPANILTFKPLNLLTFKCFTSLYKIK